MTEHRPRLSLCLATYNRARYLDRYLTHHLGAFDAAGVDYELVVSDNCSTDETPHILARYAAQHPRMRVSRQPRNLGAYPNILTTLRQARGEVVVSIADDDLGLTTQLLAYVQRMIDDPSLSMIQAPWVLMDERDNNAITGKFYDFPEARRFEPGQHLACLAFIMEHRIFPECWLIRGDLLASIAGPNPKFVYSFFWMLAQALARGAVLFSPEPHIAATAVSAGDNLHVGNAEAMESWDIYRGGLEMMASYARQATPDQMPDPMNLAGAIQGFVARRMAVAARLQANAGAWSNAYQLIRRLHAYDLVPKIGYEHNEIAAFAALETAFVECGQLGAEVIVAGDHVSDAVLERIRPIEGVRVIRPGEIREEDGRRAYCAIGPAEHPTLRNQDFAFDLGRALERFPGIPTSAA